MLIYFDSWCASQSSTLIVWSRKNQSIFSCVHASLTFYFPISLVSLWNADATWSMFEWNSALTLSRSSINFIGFFISLESWVPWQAGEGLERFFLFLSFYFIYKHCDEWFLVEFSWHTLPSLSSRSTSENNFFSSQTNWHTCQVLLE